VHSRKLYELDEKFSPALRRSWCRAATAVVARRRETTAERYIRMYIALLLDHVPNGWDRTRCDSRCDPHGNAATAQRAVQTNWRHAADRLVRAIEVMGEKGTGKSRRRNLSSFKGRYAVAVKKTEKKTDRTDKKIIAVVGATGRSRCGLVNAILKDKKGPSPCAAITRDPNSAKAKALADAGAEVVAADVDDEKSLAKAFKGAHGAFCVTFFWAAFEARKGALPGPEHGEGRKDAGVKHLICRRWRIRESRYLSPTIGCPR